MFTKNKLYLLVLQNIPVLLFIVLFIIFGTLSPRFFQYQNFENIATQASYIGILAVGMTIILLTGGIDLSVGANMYLSAVVAGLLIQNYNIPIWLALMVAIGVGFLFGAMNAFFIIKLKILPFIVTLSTLVAGRGLTLLLTQSRAVSFPDSVTQIGYTRLAGIPLPIVIFGFIVFVTYLFLKMTPLGRQIYAVGNDVEAAKKAGINTAKILAIAYIINSLLAAIGGIVSVAQLGIINAGFGEGDEFDAIAAAVLGGASLFGGVGSVFPGTVLGTVLIQMIQAGLVYLQVDLYIQPLISAAIIFFALLLDSMRNDRILKLEKRNIRVEKSIIKNSRKIVST